MRHSMKPDLRADYKIRLYTGPKPRSSRCPPSDNPAVAEMIWISSYICVSLRSSSAKILMPPSTTSTVLLLTALEVVPGSHFPHHILNGIGNLEQIDLTHDIK